MLISKKEKARELVIINCINENQRIFERKLS